MKIIPLPKLITFSLFSALSISIPAATVKAEELQPNFNITLHYPSIVSTGDIFALRVSVSDINNNGTNIHSKSGNHDEVLIEVQLDLSSSEEAFPTKIQFYGGNGTAAAVQQRQAIQVGNSSRLAAAEFLLRAISSKSVDATFHVSVREMNTKESSSLRERELGILDPQESGTLTVNPPGIQWELTRDRLLDFTKENTSIQLELFDQSSYPAPFRGDEVLDRFFAISPSPNSPIIFAVHDLAESQFNVSKEEDRITLFDIRLHSFQGNLLVISLIYSVRRSLNSSGIIPPDVDENLRNATRALEAQIPYLSEFFNEEGGFFSGCSPNVSCREIEATAAALNALSMAKRWTNEVNTTVVEKAAHYLQSSFLNDKEGKLTLEQLLDTSIALTSFNEAAFNLTKLDLNPMLNGILTSFNFTHQHSSYLSKLTFLLLRSNHSRAQEYFAKLEKNSVSTISSSSGNQQQRHWDNSPVATAYALRSYLMNGAGLETVLPIVGWLVENYYQNAEPQPASELQVSDSNSIH
jgi:hypothetical protein